MPRGKTTCDRCGDSIGNAHIRKHRERCRVNRGRTIMSFSFAFVSRLHPKLGGA